MKEKNHKHHRRYQYMPEATLEENVVHQLRACGHFLKNRPHGKASQQRILSILLRHGNMTQRELMDILRIRSASLSEVLGKIEGDGYIIRSRSESDKRNVDILLTDTGREMAKLARDEYKKAIPGWFTHMSAAEKENLCQLLEKLLSNWEEQEGGPNA